MPSSPSNLGYIALGSNLGDREALIQAALAAMRQVSGLRVLRLSRRIETAPEGFESERAFLNAVAEVEWRGAPLTLLDELQQIEASLGRQRPATGEAGANSRYADRTIDLDIIWLAGIHLVSERLTIPHPLAHQRSFVLGPLAELNPDLAASLSRPA